MYESKAFRLESLLLAGAGLILAVTVGIHVVSFLGGALQKATAELTRVTAPPPPAR